jgi:SAM-dependent methyltransferase
MNEWEAIHQSRHWGTYPEVYMARQVKSFMTGKTGTVAALDIGCGAGFMLLTLMALMPGAHVIGADLNPDIVSKAGANVRRAIEHVRDRGQALAAKAVTVGLLDLKFLTAFMPVFAAFCYCGCVELGLIYAEICVAMGHRLCAFGTCLGDVALLDSTTGVLTMASERAYSKVKVLLFSPDESRLYVGTADGRVRVYQT